MSPPLRALLSLALLAPLPAEAGLWDGCQKWLARFASPVNLIDRANQEVGGTFENKLNQIEKSFSQDPNAQEFIRGGVETLYTLNLQIIDTQRKCVRLKPKNWLRRISSLKPYEDGRVYWPRGGASAIEIETAARDILRLLLLVQLKPIGALTVFRQSPVKLFATNTRLLRSYFKIRDSINQSPAIASSILDIGRASLSVLIPLVPETGFISSNRSIIGLNVVTAVSVYRWLCLTLASFTAASLVGYGLYASPYVYKARMKFVDSDKARVSPAEKAELNEIIHFMDLSPKELEERLMRIQTNQVDRKALQKIFDDLRSRDEKK